jgi:hypothetical protein
VGGDNRERSVIEKEGGRNVRRGRVIEERDEEEDRKKTGKCLRKWDE